MVFYFIIYVHSQFIFSFEKNYSLFNSPFIRNLLAHGYSYPTPSNLNYF